ncbi:MAG TPA: universal stress protein [Micropepsaceae bacterium]|nr:universal stress protein [Micropepsaceae bacterium]
MAIKDILVELSGCDSDGSALAAAYFVAEPFGARLDILHVQPGPMDIIVHAALGQFTSKMGNTELIHALQHEAENRSLSAKAAYETFANARFPGGRNAPSGTSASWRGIEGDPATIVSQEARYSDLVVVGRGSERDDLPADAVANILVQCGRPLLLAPNAAVKSIGRTIAIAWKESAEAARAVTAAMALIERAERVLVLTADEAHADPVLNLKAAERLAQSLARHGVKSESRRVLSGSELASHTLARSAAEAGADLLVMGAYSHSRTRELVFGGFTRELLMRCDLPLLMLH